MHRVDSVTRVKPYIENGTFDAFVSFILLLVNKSTKVLIQKCFKYFLCKMTHLTSVNMILHYNH